MKRVCNNFGDKRVLRRRNKKVQTIIFCSVFSPVTDEVINEAVEKDKAMTPQERGFIRLGAFENDVIAAMEIYEYEVLFDGKPIKMAGIGNVFSSIEARGKGAIKKSINGHLK